MPIQKFAYYQTLRFSEDDNEWINHASIKKIKSQWKKSIGDNDKSNFLNSLEYLKKQIISNFDRENIIHSIGERIAPIDDDGWVEIDKDSIIYGMRKSIFSPFNPKTYKKDKAASTYILDLNFFEDDEENDDKNHKIGDDLYLTYLSIFDLDVKDKIASTDYINIWEEKFELDINNYFNFDLKDKLTEVTDEDGDSTSGYSNSTLDEGFLVCMDDTTDEEFFLLARDSALGIEHYELSIESKELLLCIKSGDTNALANLIYDRDINSPIIQDPSTAPLPFLFSAFLVGFEKIENEINKSYKNLDFKFPKKDDVINQIFLLISLGADLTYKLNNQIGYLTLSLYVSKKCTDFLLSYGISPDNNGCEDLIHSSELGLFEYVQYFIDYGADVNYSTDDGVTALLMACQYKNISLEDDLEIQENQIKIISTLLGLGANINHVDKGGDSGLTNAIRVKAWKIVEFLVNHNFERNIQNINSLAISPLSLAKDTSKDIYDLLISKGFEQNNDTSNVKKKIISKDQHLQTLKESKLSSKSYCYKCKKNYTVKTLLKNDGICSRCSNKSKPKRKKPPTRKTLPATQQVPKRESSVTESISNFFEFVGIIFELLKIITITGFILFILIAFIMALLGD